MGCASSVMRFEARAFRAASLTTKACALNCTLSIASRMAGEDSSDTRVDATARLAAADISRAGLKMKHVKGKHVI